MLIEESFVDVPTKAGGDMSTEAYPFAQRQSKGLKVP
jgi:hypothetical protein